MDNISVIIPTLWRSTDLTSKLTSLSHYESIGEIILIDNTDNKTALPDLPKIKHIQEGRNTYVNPAWNKGCMMAQSNKLCFMNDDIDVDEAVFNNVLAHITEDKGMIGCRGFAGMGIWEDEPDYNPIRPRHFRDRNLPFKVLPIDGALQSGYACLFFIHRNSYTKIPDPIKIWYGDNWLYGRSGKPNYTLMNVNVVGRLFHTSGSKEFDRVKERDKIEYDKACRGIQ